MKRNSAAYKDRWRIWVVATFLSLLTIGLIARVLYLTIWDRQFLKQQGQARSLRTVEIPAYRGMVTDRNGHPLAISSPVDTVWANPQQVALDNPQLIALARLLEFSPKELKSKIQQNSHKEFFYLKRHIDPAIGAKVRGLGVEGVYIQQEYRRFYPEAEAVAQVTGFTNIDERGQEGIELAFDNSLKGVPGLQRVVKDRRGHVVAMQEEIRAARAGQDVVLGLDYNIQYIAWSELKKAVVQHAAQSGSMVILDVKTGEILAMTNYPSYNPNQRAKTRDDKYRNRVVTDLFEPGSTIKAFSVLNGIKSGKFKPDSKIDTSPGWMALNRKVVKDHNDLGEITVTEVLQHSSNVGVAKITLSVHPNSLFDLLKSLGFGKITDSEFPGEAAGVLEKPYRWSDFTLATLSFGYGMSVNLLQLAQAYATIASGGLKRPVTLQKVAGDVPEQRIFSAQIAQAMLDMLESVTKRKGTAKTAMVEGYRVAGKTGTVRMLGAHGGYDKNRHIGMFVGIVPVTEPRLVAAVVLVDPKSGKYYGGDIAAPVFAKVMQEVLPLMDISPDNLATTE